MTDRSKDTIAQRQVRVGVLADKGLHPRIIARQVGAPLRTVHKDLDAMGFELPTHHHQSCGTASGYRNHHRLGETPCEPCRTAKRHERNRTVAPDAAH
ncbi:transcriptional regulator WhiB-like [Gordonia phage Obliviate]|uniref:transcriptional regulator WhiB-like n=1 Tax=Gordonia phage Obliviate TaxID=1821559 RepID=UPI00078DD55C|nr:transcriptional regulator WhiB-like [Gordonia phage Obliviate]AMS03144.1 hypothetical protein SEA_OBLIVIATE_65 [Gordonia phage Obliviate]